MKDIRQEFWESPTVVKSFIDRPPSSYITKVLDYFIKNNPDWKVLDIGCGGGRYSKYLKDHNINITAIDKHEKITMALQENEVPFILVNYDPAYTLREGGCLADIIPTLIEVMGKEQPVEMTGKSLLIKK